MYVLNVVIAFAILFFCRQLVFAGSYLVSGLNISLAFAALLVVVLVAPTSAEELEWVRVSDDDKGFVMTESGTPFIPWGFNYDHEGDGQLLEDYWDDKWHTVESAFQEMKDQRKD